MSDDSNTTVKTAQDYYNSQDADQFYYEIWGGEDIHIGLYQSADEPIAQASARTVERMADHLEGITADSRILDIGAGYGGSARYLTKRFGCHVTCLNLSEVQNQRNREKNAAEGLADKITVVDGNFEELPFEDDAFDAVWSQDAILHSGRRQRVFEEVNRVLKGNGSFIFTDPMQASTVDPEVLAPVLARIHLDSMGSYAVYDEYAAALHWETVGIEKMPEQLINHYSAVLANLTSREDTLKTTVAPSYIERMKGGLQHWIAAGKKDALTWGIAHYRKMNG